MKRFFSTVLLSALIAFLFFMTGCGPANGTKKLSISESYNNNLNELTAGIKAPADFRQISGYLVKWAAKNGITTEVNAGQVIVLSKPASKGYGKAQALILQTSVSFDNDQVESNDLQCVAFDMAALYSAEKQGRITAVITLQKEGRPVGAGALNPKYLKGGACVAVRYSDNPSLTDSLAASFNITASQPITMAPPAYTKAYKIDFSGSAYKSPYQYSEVYPNAIKAIGDLLASSLSSNILFDLASFHGGGASSLFPAHAEAIVVLQENDVDNFMKEFDTSYGAVSGDYQKVNEPFTYTIKPVRLPKKVISTDNGDNIISFMYTLTDGTYYKSDNGDVLAASNIGTVSTGNHNFQIRIDAKSLSVDIKKEMLADIKTTCGLSNMKYREVAGAPLRKAGPGSDSLIQALSQNPKITPAGALEDIDAAVFLHKEPNLPLILYGVNQNSGPAQIQTLLSYMEGSAK